MTHTPGPWTVWTESNGAHQFIERKTSRVDSVLIAELAPAHEVNANLIAAAPEMLEALRHAANDLESRIYLLPVDADATERAILEAQRNIYWRAIAKAEGRA